VSLFALKHHSQFQEILSKYDVSESAKQALAEIKLVLLIAPTSAGKNTIIRRQLQTGRYYFIVSDTTRPPRENDGVMEQNGREYWFRTEEEMINDLKNGEYLEAEIIHGQKVSGISIRELKKDHVQHKIAITDVDLKGMHHVMRAKPDTFAVMLVPPSFDEWQRRLNSRGRMSEQELKRRLKTAQQLFDDGLSQDYYQFVISENVEQSASLIDAIVEGKSNPHQGRAPGLILSLQESLGRKLDSLERV
jgi:guanylate kinase